jgi:hypothetical protein
MTQDYIPLTISCDDHTCPVRYERLPTDSRTLNLPGGTFTIHPDGCTYSYAYGPKGLAGLQQNRFALLCAFFASIGGLEFGYDQGVVSTSFLLIALLICHSRSRMSW